MPTLGHTDAGLQPGFPEYAVADQPADLLAAAQQPLAAGDVQEGLVQREALHQRGDVVEDPEHLFGDLAVAGHAGLQVLRAGAQAAGARHRHRRVHAEAARRIVGGRDHPAPAQSPDNDGPAGQFRPVTLFHRSVEGIHVDMDDGALPVLGHGSVRLEARGPDDSL